MRRNFPRKSTILLNKVILVVVLFHVLDELLAGGLEAVGDDAGRRHEPPGEFAGG